jgi:hypothetical protein
MSSIGILRQLRTTDHKSYFFFASIRDLDDRRVAAIIAEFRTFKPARQRRICGSDSRTNGGTDRLCPDFRDFHFPFDLGRRELLQRRHVADGQGVKVQPFSSTMSFCLSSESVRVIVSRLVPTS